MDPQMTTVLVIVNISNIEYFRQKIISSRQILSFPQLNVNKDDDTGTPEQFWPMRLYCILPSEIVRNLLAK